MKLFYWGPDRQALHDDYVKQGRIDERAPVQARCSVTIEAPVERVWSVLSAVSDWDSVDPKLMPIEVPEEVEEDAPFVWKSGRSTVRSRFAVVEPNRELSWTGTSSGARAAHRHVLSSVAGGTRIDMEESMAGPLLPLLYPSAKLQADMEKWLAALKAAAERR